MLTRRIVAGACALCLAVPAAAGAKDVHYVGHAHPAVVVATGDTKSDLPGAVAVAPPGDTKSDLPGAAAVAPPGDTKADLPRAVAVVPPGATKADLPRAVAVVPPGDTKDDLPSTPASHNTAVAPRSTSPAAASTDDATNGWRLAAVIEGGLLVAFALGGAAVFMTGRRHRAPRMGV
jgi:hypothetical protein